MHFTAHVRKYSPRLWFYFKFLNYKYRKGEREIRMLSRLVPKDKIAIDIGSSIGLYTRELARLVPKVIAFEANPAVAEFAAMVAPRNVEIINVALSASNGRTVLRVPINAKGRTINDLATVEARNDSFGGKVLNLKIATKRLDDYQFRNCGFIKIDVEGHEEAVLDGAMYLIETQRPILMIELVNAYNPGTIERTVDRFSRMSYSAYFFSERRLRPFEEFDERLHQNLELVALSPRGGKIELVENFIFVPTDAILRLNRGS
jgi:FkbM family methyltransferase